MVEVMVSRVANSQLITKIIINIRDNRYKYAAFIMMLVMYGYIAYCVPYVHDDWIAGSSYGFEISLSGVCNGRYVANLLIDVLVRIPILKTIFMASVFWLIPFEVSRLFYDTSDKRFLTKYLIVNLIFLLINPSIWGETYGWLSGFCVFTVPALLTLYYLRMNRKLLTDDAVSSYKWYEYAGMFIYSAFVQLFIEGATGAFLMMSGILLIYAIKRRRYILKAAIILLGSIVGLAVMLTSPMYWEVFEKGESVDKRGLSVDVQSSILTKLWDALDDLVNNRIYDCLKYDIWIIGILCVYILIMKLWEFKKNRSISKRNIIFASTLCVAIGFRMSVLLLVFYVILLSYLFRKSSETKEYTPLIKGIVYIIANQFILLILYLSDNHLPFNITIHDLLTAYLYVVVYVYIYRRIEKSKRGILSFTALFMMLQLLPLTIVIDSFARLYYIPEVLKICILSAFVDAEFDNVKAISGYVKHRYMYAIMCVVIMLAFSRLAVVMTNEHYIYMEWNRIIEQAKTINLDEIHVPRYPNTEYLYYDLVEYRYDNIQNMYNYYGIDYSVKFYYDQQLVYNGDPSTFPETYY